MTGLISVVAADGTSFEANQKSFDLPETIDSEHNRDALIAQKKVIASRIGIPLDEFHNRLRSKMKVDEGNTPIVDEEEMTLSGVEVL